jgi:DNA polymerase III subunit delta'
LAGELINFEQILGQQSATEAISKAYRSNRLPHGMIFAGPAGVGKATTARALGGLFLCEKPRQLAACGKCDSCRVLAAGNHPDFHVVYRQLARIDKDVVAKELAVDVIRDFLVARASNTSVQGVGKVFVVEEADLMTSAAQNAMLKTLEEPSGRTVIILLTDQPDCLLPTIRSRCQLVRFARLDEKVVSDQLRKRGIDAKLATQAAQFSEGSLGLALRWIEDGVIERATELTRMLEKSSASQPPGPMQAWFKQAADAYAEKQLKRDDLASKSQATREGLVLYIKLASQFYRRRLGDVDDPEPLCQAIDALVRAEEYAESNVNLPLVIQQLCGALLSCVAPPAAAYNTAR